MAFQSIKNNSFFKAITIAIIACVVAAALIGIGLLFNIVKPTDTVGKIMLTLLTIFIAGLFLLNSVNALAAGNKVGIVSAFMLSISALLCIGLIWLKGVMGDFVGVYGKIVVIVAIASILLNLIIGNYVTFGKKLIVIQIIQYITFAYVELVLAFVILGNNTLINFWHVFAICAIVTLTLYAVLTVKQKGVFQANGGASAVADGDVVTISREEYERLKDAEKQLKEISKKINKG